MEIHLMEEMLQKINSIQELKKVFPDATFVVTHRDPVSVIQSTITMLAYGQRMNRKKVLINELADYWSDRVEHLLRRCVETRQLLPPEQSIPCLQKAILMKKPRNQRWLLSYFDKQLIYCRLTGKRNPRSH